MNRRFSVNPSIVTAALILDRNPVEHTGGLPSWLCVRRVMLKHILERAVEKWQSRAIVSEQQPKSQDPAGGEPEMRVPNPQ